MKKTKKVLILVPATTARGGITNYYQVLKNEFQNNIEYFERGARTWPVRNGFASELIRAWKDYKAFKKRVAKNDIALVQTTTSLSLSTTIRDGLFIRYANKKSIKTIVFFRGWDDAAVKKVEKKYLKLFKYFFFGANSFIILSKKAKNKLIQWGYKRDIHVETTLVDKALLTNVNEAFIIEKFEKLKETNKINLLFLSRIEIKKGVYELLQAFKLIVNNNYKNNGFHLNICGDGFELDNVKNWIESNKLYDISLQGFVSGVSKRVAFEKAHIFVFPSHSEGMPNAVLEAMGFGLPVITTPVGGLVDFFNPDKHGSYIQINDVADIVSKIEYLLSDKNILLPMALNNHKMTNDLFRSDRVAKRIEKIFNKVLKN